MDKNKIERSFTFGDAARGMGRIVSYVAEFKKEFAILCVAGFIGAFVSPIATYFFSRIISAISKPHLLFGSVSASIGFSVLWVVLTFLSLSLDRFSQLRGKILDEKARIKFLISIDEFILHLPMSFHKSTNSGSLWDTINRASNAIVDLFSNAVIPLAPQAISIVVMLGISFYVNWIFGALFLVGASLYVASVAYSAIPNAFLLRRMQHNYSIARGHASDTLANVRAVKDFAAEDYERSRSVELFEKVGLSGWISYITHMVKTGYVQRSIIFVTQAATLILSVVFISEGKLTVADLVLFNAYVMSIFSPLSQLSGQWRSIQNGIIALEDAEKIREEALEVYVPEGSAGNISLAGAVEFRNVSFSYDAGQKILDDVSFATKPGDVIALVGESGVGKSTTMDLISAYHFATEGSVLMDGIDIRNIALHDIRSQIGVVPQETVLFNDTVKNNLRYGNFNATDAEVEAAAKKAHCYDFIQKFPKGWETIVGERGLKLSVGQKQRISIARAILRDPKILILDEPTSALDAGTEKIITESLEQLMAGRTTFIIAHRLSTVRRADLILVFKDGKIVERGTHKQLLHIANGEYKRLHSLQIGLHE